MRPQKVNDAELMAGLMAVFRTKGYEGTSLNDLAVATGLQKASLYHRFPGGKKEIAEAVLAYAKAWIGKHVRQVLEDSQELPAVRLVRALDNIRELYGNGKEICILRALSMDQGLSLFGQGVQQNMEEWIAGFYQLGLDLGLEPKAARESAEDTLIMVQGSLVVGKGIGDTSLFDRAIKHLGRLYLK
ncbi:MAG: TetR/AcrR family transcriptional regulator [Bacteroidota bacterium]